MNAKVVSAVPAPVTLAVFMTLALSACGKKDTHPATEALTLTPDYLDGSWCFSHTDNAGEVEAENVNYRFGRDGDLAVQTSAQRDVVKDGFTWAMQKDGFKMSHQPGTSTVVSIEPDAFVLRYFVNLHFERGACKAS